MAHPSRAARAARFVRWLGLAALVAYALLLGVRFTPVAAGSDSSGYYNSARLLTQGRLADAVRPVGEVGAISPWLLTPLGFVGHLQEGRLLPTYPIGTPLHFAAAASVAGWFWGPLVAGVAAALLALWLSYLSARELDVPPALALVVPVALASSAVFLFAAVQPLSDVLATTWAVASMYAALRSRRPAQGHWAFAAGAAFGIGVLVRPSNLVLLPALALLTGRWARLVRMALGGLPLALGLAIYQRALYGDATTSGYGDIFGAFSPDWVVPSIRNFAPWTARMLPVALCAVLLGWWLPWRSRTREVLALVLWTASLVGFYLFYTVSHEVWWTLRFVLPAYPAAVVLAVLAVDGLRRSLSPARAPRFELAAAIFLIVLSVAGGWHWDRTMHLGQFPEGERAYPVVTRWAGAHLPPDAAVACMQVSGSLWFYTDLAIVRYDVVDAETGARVVDAVRRTGRPFYAVVFEHEYEELHRRLPGSWERVHAIGNVGFWRLAAPAS